MISVVAFLHFKTNGLIIQSLYIGKGMQVFVKITMQFLVCNAANINIIAPHGDILQIVQVAEHTHLSKLGHACQETKFDVSVHRFQYAIERFQRITVLLLQLFVADSLQHRFVVFIHKDGDTVTGLLHRTLYDSFKAEGKSRFTRSRTILFLPSTQSIIQYFVQTVRRIILPDIQIQMQYGTYRPILFQLFYRQPFKQFPLSTKVSFQCRKQQAFAETPRTTEKIIASGSH